MPARELGGYCRNEFRSAFPRRLQRRPRRTESASKVLRLSRGFIGAGCAGERITAGAIAISSAAARFSGADFAECLGSSSQRRQSTRHMKYKRSTKPRNPCGAAAVLNRNQFDDGGAASAQPRETSKVARLITIRQALRTAVLSPSPSSLFTSAQARRPSRVKITYSECGTPRNSCVSASVV